MSAVLSPVADENGLSLRLARIERHDLGVDQRQIIVIPRPVNLAGHLGE
jgi:hypothetical protein